MLKAFLLWFFFLISWVRYCPFLTSEYWNSLSFIINLIREAEAQIHPCKKLFYNYFIGIELHISLNS